MSELPTVPRLPQLGPGAGPPAGGDARPAGKGSPGNGGVSGGGAPGGYSPANAGPRSTVADCRLGVRPREVCRRAISVAACAGPLLREARIEVPTQGRELAGKLGYHSDRLIQRGYGYSERSEFELGRADMERIDLCWVAVRRLRGVRAGAAGARAVAQADALLAMQNIHEPEAWLRVSAPGLSA